MPKGAPGSLHLEGPAVPYCFPCPVHCWAPSMSLSWSRSCPGSLLPGASSPAHTSHHSRASSTRLLVRRSPQSPRPRAQESARSGQRVTFWGLECGEIRSGWLVRSAALCWAGGDGIPWWTHQASGVKADGALRASVVPAVGSVELWVFEEVGLRAAPGAWVGAGEEGPQ